MKNGIKKFISVGILAFIAGLIKIDGIVNDAPLHVPEEYAASTPTAKIRPECSIFNQTGVDIYTQQSNEDGVFFSGCAGFL